MEDPEDELHLTYRLRLTVSPGLSVVPIQGIVQKELVIAFLMGTHPRMGGASAVRLLDVELLMLVCSFADIWRDDGVVVREAASGDSMSYCLFENGCELGLCRYTLSDLRHLTEPRRARRKLDHWFLKMVVNVGNAQPLTWTEAEIV
jgi:hypothetical protein